MTEMCPFCKIEHKIEDFGSMRILVCPMTPPDTLWYFNTKYIDARYLKGYGD